MYFMDSNMLLFMDAYFLVFLTVLSVYLILRGFSFRCDFTQNKYVITPNEQPKPTASLLHFFHNAIKQLLLVVRRKINVSDGKEDAMVIPHSRFSF